MKRALTVLAVAALAAGSCTNVPPDVPTPSPTVSPVPSPSPPPVFDVTGVVAHIRALSERIGRRDAASASYRAAADYTARIFASYGYRVVRQRVPIPAGTTEGVAVPAGTSQNVIAYPRGYDPVRPHVVVGGHLDSVPVSPGANDNGSGAASVLELARLASLAPARVPIVFVEFTGEERRLKGPQGAMFGSRTYFGSLSRAERAATIAMMNLDMIGNGPVTLVCRRSSSSPRRFLDAALQAARRLRLPARENIVTKFFSDSVPFETAGIPVAWLWSGEHPTVHTSRDTMKVIRSADLERSGLIAWETVRTFT